MLGAGAGRALAQGGRQAWCPMPWRRRPIGLTLRAPRRRLGHNLPLPTTTPTPTATAVLSGVLAPVRGSTSRLLHATMCSSGDEDDNRATPPGKTASSSADMFSQLSDLSLRKPKEGNTTPPPPPPHTAASTTASTSPQAHSPAEKPTKEDVRKRLEKQRQELTADPLTATTAATAAASSTFTSPPPPPPPDSSSPSSPTASSASAAPTSAAGPKVDKVDPTVLRELMARDWQVLRQENLSKQAETQAFLKDVVQQKQPNSTYVTLMLSLGGNVAISLAKFYAWSRTGHSAMFAEAVHTLVDVGNQAILGYGLREAERSPDMSYHYGYGRAAFFYSLLAALSTFGFGSLYTFYQAVQVLTGPSQELMAGPETWAVLGVSLVIDGYVLSTAWQSVRKRSEKAKLTPWQWISAFRDPFVVSVVFEDSAAVVGVLLAAGGITASHITGNHLWDALASLSISALLGAVSLKLVSLNRQFILGKPLDQDVEEGILSILKGRRSIDAVFAVQTQWVGPSAFSYKAEVDFDGTYLAARVFEQYEKEFLASAKKNSLAYDLGWLLPCVAEDVTRVLEQEVEDIQREIRQKYKQAAFVEIVPDSSQTTKSALKEMTTLSRRAEQSQLLALIATSMPSKPQVGEDHVQYYTLGSNYIAMGHFEKAVEALNKCLALRQRVFGPGHANVANVLERLGKAYLGVGALPRAKSSLEAAIKILESVPDPDKHTLAQAYKRLAFVFRDMKIPTRASAYLVRALDLAEHIYGRNARKTVDILEPLVQVLTNMPAGKAQSIQYLMWLLGIAEANEGPDSLAVSRVLDQLSLVCFNIDKKVESLEAAKRSCDIKLHHYGNTHLEVATALHSVGLRFLALQQPEEAYHHFQRALAIRRKLLYGTHPDVIKLHNKVRDLETRLGLYFRRP